MNLHDIAKEAGVSIATVSRVINGSPLVVEETRRRVQAVIDKHSYTPNALARGLIQNSTRTIGVLTVDIRVPYFAAVVHNVEKELKRLGYNIFLCNTGGELEEKIRYIRALFEKKVDGLVFVGSVYKEKNGNQHIIDAAKKVPVVLLNNHINAENVFSLLCNDFKGIYEAAMHMYRTGCREFVYIDYIRTFSGYRKRKGFTTALTEAGINRNHWRILKLGLDDIPVIERIKSEFARRPFDALLAGDDSYANQTVIALQELGISVPKQVSVAGYNNSFICGLSYPQLTSVDSRMERLGTEGALLMDEILKGNRPERRARFLDPELVLRKSTL